MLNNQIDFQLWHRNLSHVQTQKKKHTGTVIKRTDLTHRLILSHARKRYDAIHWKRACEKELRMHDHFGTLQLVDEHKLPKRTTALRPVITFTYKRDKNGEITGYKVRASYPGNRLIPGLHYDPDTIAAYAADRDAIRLILALSVNMDMQAYHLDLTCAFIY